MTPLRLYVLSILCFAFLSIQAQQYEPGIVRVKIKEAYSKKISNVKLKNGEFGLPEIDQLKLSLGVTNIKRLFRPAGKFERAHEKFGLHLWYEIVFQNSTSVNNAISAYKKLSHFEFVEAKQKFHSIDPIIEQSSGTSTNSLTSPTNDPLFSNQWHYKNTGQTGGTTGADIALEQAWANETGNGDVIVAVIDGGIDHAHPDLSASMWINDDEVAGNGIDDDSNGYIDDIYGYGFGDNTGTIYPHYHGTHVAGTIAAVTNNGIGVAGIAGGNGTGNGVRLMSCAGFGSMGVGGFEDAMVYAADNGAVISQNSWGGGSSAIEAAIDYFIARAGYDNSDANFDDNIQIGPMAGGLVIFAAGNSNTDSPSNGYPASYSPAMAVASTTHTDERSYFSNYGAWVDIAAPGSSVYSTYPVSQGSYATLSGTSMACPHVSGVAALIISQFGGAGLVPNQVWDRLQQTADDIDGLNPGYEDKLGSGRVNAYNALQVDDDVPPATITDLSIEELKLTSVILNWTAPGGSDMEGVASAYEIRYSTSPINDSNFGAATEVSSPPTPQAAGTSETFEVTGLDHNTFYYFSIRSSDFFGNISNIANVVSGTTLQPPVIDVSPDSLTETLFTGASSIQYLTIENNGLSDLHFSLRSSMVGTLSARSEIRGAKREITMLQNHHGSKLHKAETKYPLLTRNALPHSRANSIAPSPGTKTLSAGRLFSLDHYDGKIIEIDTESGEIINTITPPEDLSHGPDGLAFDGTYLYYISGFGSNQIHQIDASSGDLIASLSLSSLGLIDALAHSGKYIYAQDVSAGLIHEIDFEAGILVRSINPGVSLMGGLTFGGSRGTLFASFISSAIYEIDITTGAVVNSFFPPATIYGLGYSNESGLLFVANVDTGNTDAIDPDTGEVLYSLYGILSAALASDESGSSWLQVDNTPTVLAPGASLQIPVHFNAEQSIGGVYSGNIQVTSNDPVTPTVNVPVLLTVFGAPNIDLDVTELDFNSQFINYTYDKTVLVRNTGTDILTVSSIEVTGTGFSTGTSPFTVSPGESDSVTISFMPIAEEMYNGLLQIISDDPDQDTIEIALIGEGILPPEILVSPAAIADSLLTDQQTTHVIVIENNGGSTLAWTASVSMAEALSVATKRKYFNAEQQTSVFNNDNKQLPNNIAENVHPLAAGDFTSRAASPAALTCVTTNPSTGFVYAQQNQGNMFYQYNPSTNAWSGLQNSPVNSGNNGGAAYLNGKIYTSYTNNSTTIGVYTIATNSWTTIINGFGYGTANITSDGTFIYMAQAYSLKKYDPTTATWTTLASAPIYFESWGGLSVYQGVIYGHKGNGYTGFAKYTIATNTWEVLPSVPGAAVLGCAIDPTGIYYTYGSYGGNNLYAYSIEDNEWSVTTIPLFNVHDGGLAFVGKSGTSGIYFVQGESGTGFGKFETLPIAQWLSITDVSGTLEVGKDTVLTVTLNATDLLGGDYSGTVTIISNDPAQPEIDVPISLHVTGAPNISVDISAVDFQKVYTNTERDSVITIKNIGTDVLNIASIAVTGTGFSCSKLPFTLSPGDTDTVTVSFIPLGEETYNGLLQIISNDPDQDTIQIELLGEGVLPPEIGVTPSIIADSLITDQQVTHELVIENNGGSPLTWTASVFAEEPLRVKTEKEYFIPGPQTSAINNSNEQLTPVIAANMYPLALGDFALRAASPAALTCVTTDPTSGIIYAQANDGTGFYKYTPSSNVWTTLQNCPLYSGNNGGATYLNGKIYTSYTGNNSTLGVYTISTNTWTTITNGFGSGTANITSDGTFIYLVHGYNFKKYNPTSATWTTLANSPISFERWGGLSVHNGVIYGHKGNGTTGFAKYTIATNTWAVLPSVPGPAVLGCAIDAGGTYYTYGSYDGNNFYAYDIDTNEWSAQTMPLFYVRDGGLAFVGQVGVSGIYFIEGESGTDFGRFESLSNGQWLSVEDLSGTVEAGEDTVLTVTLDATDLYGGDYAGVVSITSNDPLQPEIEIPVSLHVTGASNIDVNVSTIDFQTVYLNTVRDSIITVKNIGTDILTISSIEVMGSAFSTDTETFNLLPNESKIISVSFSPVTPQVYAGIFQIISNDPDQDTIEIELVGEGVLPPQISVSPSSITHSLLTNQQTTREIVIENNGGATLTWTASVSVTEPLNVQTEKKYFTPAPQGSVTNNSNQQIVTAIAENVYPLAVGDFSVRAASPASLTCVTADPTTGIIYAQANEGTAFYKYTPSTNEWTSLQHCPVYSGNNGGAVYLNGKIYTSYTDYSSIGVYTIATNSWTTISNGSGYTTGNIASDGTFIYLAQGYSLRKYNPTTTVWTTLANPPIYFQSWGGISVHNGVMYGHEGNGFFGFAKYTIATNTWEVLPSAPGGAVLGCAIDPSGIYYTYGSYNGYNLFAFDIDDNEWSVVSIPLFSVRDGGLAFVGQAGVGGIYFVQGEWGTGFGRFESLSSTKWLSLAEHSGSLEAGEDTVLTVTLDATNLFGGDYSGTITIASNDPVLPEIDVPVSLHVTGTPDIEINHDEVNFNTVYVNTMHYSSITIKNRGTQNLDISSVTVNDSAFVIPIDPLTLSPGDTLHVPIQFFPTQVRDYNALLTIYSNDVDEPEKAIALKANVVNPPLTISPAEIQVELNQDNWTSRDLTITNNTTEWMDWFISIQSYDSLSSWFFLGKYSGTLAPNSTEAVEVYFVSDNLPIGRYEAVLGLYSNWIDGPDSYINISMEVTSKPDIEITEELIFPNTYVDHAAEQIVTIANTGTELLAIDSIITSERVFTIIPSNVQINPGESTAVTVIFLPLIPGDYSGTITLYSNDQEDSVLNIPMSGTAMPLPVLNVTPETQHIKMYKKEEREVAISIHNGGQETIYWQLSSLPDWAEISSDSGSLEIDETNDLILMVNTFKLTDSLNSFTVTFHYNHPSNGIIEVPFTIEIIQNEAPKVILAIEDQTVGLHEDGFSFNLALNFEDPEGESLKYMVASSNDSIGLFTLVGSVLTFEPLQAGSADVTVTAQDLEKAEASIGFTITVNMVTGVETYERLSLKNSPNPFTNQTRFTYHLDKPGHVSVVIQDLNGRTTGKLVNEYQHAGNKELLYNGNATAAGVYFYHLIIDGKIAGSGKMLKN